MEGYGEHVSETDLWHLVNYLKELGCGARDERLVMPAGVSPGREFTWRPID